jgi:polysaccharide export outer membrane protein
VTVYQDKDMSLKTHVDSDGSISMPLAGRVPVAGATVAEAQKRIEEKLGPYFVKPTVSVVVESYGAKQLFVLGEVQKPGPYPMPASGHVSVLQAVTDAGGFTKAAAPRRTHVLRYADGKSQDFKIDLKSLIKHRGSDILLEPNDVIFVPQTLF